MTRHRGMSRLWAIAVAMAAAFAGSAIKANAGVTSVDVSPPGEDPFYSQPQSFDGDKRGQILRHRTVKLSKMPDYVAYQVQYVSTNTTGLLQADVATIIKPRVRTGAPKLVSFQPPIDTLSYNCDPSYTLRTGAEGDIAKLSILLSHGWTVVVPDFLGPKHEWAAGYVEARGTLDGIRASENFRPAGLSGRATPVGMTGYSGGARGTEFANELAPTYAPELNIIGAAAGGLAVDVGDVLQHLNGGPAAGIAFAGFLGIGRAYPSLGADELLNPAGKEMQRRIGNMCITQFVGAFTNEKIETYTVGGVNPWNLARVRAIFSQLTAGMYGTPGAPTYLYVGSSDELVVPANDRKLAQRYCAKGLPVDYVMLSGDHHAADVSGFSGAVEWLDARFSGRSATGNCSILQ